MNIIFIVGMAGSGKSSLVGNFKEWLYKILTELFIFFFAKKPKAVRIINQKQTGEFLVNSGINKEKLKYIPAFYIDFNIYKHTLTAYDKL